MYCVYAYDVWSLIGYIVTMEHNIYTFIVGIKWKITVYPNKYMQLPQDLSYLEKTDNTFEFYLLWKYCLKQVGE